MAAAEQAKEVAASAADATFSSNVVAAGCGRQMAAVDSVQGDDHELFTLSAAASGAAQELDLTVEGLLVAEAVQEALIARGWHGTCRLQRQPEHTLLLLPLSRLLSVAAVFTNRDGHDCCALRVTRMHVPAVPPQTAQCQVPDAADGAPVADGQGEHMWSAPAAEALAAEAKSAEAAAADGSNEAGAVCIR